MKKFVSSLLVCSTLFSCVEPNLYCSAEDKVTSTKQTTSKNTNNDLSEADKEALKKAILELANDKMFTNQVIKNYTKAHEAPTWLKALKILLLPFRACWYLIKKAFDYTVGKTAADFIQNKVIPILITFLTGLAIYNKIPFVHKFIDYIISFIKTSSNETE